MTSLKKQIPVMAKIAANAGMLKNRPARHKLVKATFTGSENRTAAMGFVRHQQYTLMVEHNPKVDGLIRITNQATPFQECEYESLLSFLGNWDKIEKVSP